MAYRLRVGTAPGAAPTGGPCDAPVLSAPLPGPYQAQQPNSLLEVRYVCQVKEKSLVLHVMRVAGFSRDARFPIG